jgi:hypothetical protein
MYDKHLRVAYPTKNAQVTCYYIYIVCKMFFFSFTFIKIYVTEVKLSILKINTTRTKFSLICMNGCLQYLTSKLKTKLRGFSPQANYTDRATAACRRS